MGTSKYNFNCDIRDLNTMSLSDEFYNFDILDGISPCQVFSMAGKKRKDWGIERKFKKGQKKAAP